MSSTTIPTYQLLNPNEPASLFTMRSVQAEEEQHRIRENKMPDTEIPHRHNCYTIFFVADFAVAGGSVVHMIDAVEYPICTNVLAFISPNQIHQVPRSYPPSLVLEKMRIVSMSFTREFAHRHPLLDDIEPERSQFQIADADAAFVDALCNQMFHEFSSGNALAERIIKNHLDTLLSLISRIADASPTALSTDVNILKEFRRLVNTQYLHEQSPSHYARQLNISPGYFSEIIKKQTGKTPSRIIAERVVLEAKRLLVHTSDSVKEISYKLNFNEATYFYRFFKKHAGQTPEQFRGEIRKKYSLI